MCETFDNGYDVVVVAYMSKETYTSHNMGKNINAGKILVIAMYDFMYEVYIHKS